MRLAEIHLAQSVGLLSPDYGSGEMRYLIRHILESCNIFAYFPKACNEELLIFHFHYYQKRRVTIKTLLVVLVPEQRGMSACLGHSSNDPTVKLSRELLKRRPLGPLPSPCPFGLCPHSPSDSQKDNLYLECILKVTENNHSCIQDKVDTFH